MVERDFFTVYFPASRVHLGIPTGNSDAGFLLFGERNELKICFSLASCWDHRNDQIMERPCPYDDLISLFDPYSTDSINRKLQESATEFRCWTDDFWWPSTRIPGGRIVLELREDISRLILDYVSGMITVYTASGSIRVLASMKQNSLLIQDCSGLIVQKVFHPAFEFLKSERLFEKGGAGGDAGLLFFKSCMMRNLCRPGTKSTGMTVFCDLGLDRREKSDLFHPDLHYLFK